MDVAVIVDDVELVNEVDRGGRILRFDCLMDAGIFCNEFERSEPVLNELHLATSFLYVDSGTSMILIPLGVGTYFFTILTFSPCAGILLLLVLMVGLFLLDFVLDCGT